MGTDQSKSLAAKAVRYAKRHPFAYALMTMNRDDIALAFSRKQYPSRFGGLWIDKEDFDGRLAKKRVPDALIAPLRKFREDGFAILPRAIPEQEIDRLLDRFRRLPKDAPDQLLVTSPRAPRGQLYKELEITLHASQRIVDCYFFFEEARALLFAEPIVEFLRLIFETEPLLTQSLSFEFGSEQWFHQDTSFVVMTSPLRFAAAWIALEDVKPGSGALSYFPGSHRWSDFVFNGRFKHWDQERDGLGALERWNAWMWSEIEAHQRSKQHFEARKGDVLIWHAGLIHGGEPVTDETATRRSLVGHYCPAHVRPLYHLYNPRQRKVYVNAGRRYTTEYYR